MNCSTSDTQRWLSPVTIRLFGSGGILPLNIQLGVSAAVTSHKFGIHRLTLYGMTRVDADDRLPVVLTVSR